MPQKPLVINDAGIVTETNPATTSAGAGDAGKLVALDAAGMLDNSLLRTTNETTGIASEAIGSGAFINLWNDNGTQKYRLADAASAKKADGYASTGGAQGATIKVVLREGLNGSLSGLTAGTDYFLGNAGAVTTTPPTASGSLLQKLGTARSATELSFAIQTPVIRA